MLAVMNLVERIVESGLVPESVLRAGIRAVCGLRLRQERATDRRAFVDTLRASDVAIETVAANAQHYEVPAAFFERVLGPRLKYSACYWPRGVTTLAERNGDARAHGRARRPRRWPNDPGPRLRLGLALAVGRRALSQ